MVAVVVAIGLGCLAHSSAAAQRAIRSPSDVRALGRLLRIEDTRRDEPAFVDSLLGNASAALRARAALAAGRIGGRAHIPGLRERTADPDTAVAASAWFALALLRDTAAAPLAGTSLHDRPCVATEAARLLGEIGEPGRPFIVAGLGDSSLGADVRGALLVAAARLRPVPTVAVVPWTTSADSGVAWRAAYVVARGRSPAGVRPLLAVEASSSSAVREQVARGLSRSAAGDSLADSAFAALRRLAGDPQPRVRVNTVRSLASYGARARPAIVTALRDRDAGVRVAVAQSLGAVLDSVATPWRAAFRSDTALAFQLAVAEGAASHGLLLEGTSRWRTSREWRRRVGAVQLDGRGSADSAAARLDAWLRDRDPRVRSTAASALVGLRDSVKARAIVRTGLRHALRDDDPFVRAAALGGLASGASAADLALALDAYARSRRDREADARLAFWALVDSALTRVGATLPESLDRRLAALPRPGDPLERSAAARMARFAAWADSTGTPRPLAWYEARAREASYHPRRTAMVETARGVMELQLFAWDAPLTVHDFATLADRHYFDGQRFHRVVPNFVIQAGDPRGDGNGGPGYAIRDELNARRYGRGTVGMALSGPNTGGSQFFVTHSPQPHLDGGYTVFGQLRSGFDVLDRIVQGDRIVRITVR